MADFALIVVLFLFIYSGYKNGFARTLINAAANIISVVFGILLTGPVANIICNSALGEFIRNCALSSMEKNEQLTSEAVSIAADGIAIAGSTVISFILISLLVRVAVGLVAGAVDIVAKLPLIKQANRILGAVVGGISGILICYVVIGFIFILSENGAAELDGIVAGIENSILCSGLYYNNMIGNILSSV